MAAKIRIRAERRGGELLREMAAKGKRLGRGGDQKSKPHDGSLKPPTLKELGVTPKEAETWQARWLRFPIWNRRERP